MATTRVFRTSINTQLELFKSSDSQSNTKLGSKSLQALTTGQRNTAIGDQSGYRITSGTNNIAIGQDALYQATTGDDNIAIGYASLSGNGYNNIAIGYKALGGISNGSYNLGAGEGAGYSLGSGSYNVVIGRNQGNSVKDTNNNIIISDGQGNIRIQSDSTGAVRMPGQPAFSVYALNRGTQSGTLTYNATNSNIGGYIDLNTGIFTAPADGHYHFNYYGFVDQGLAGNTTVAFQKNGAYFPSRAYNDFNDTSYGPVITISAVIYLYKSDNVRVSLSGAGMHGNDNSYFSGFLIG
jgi:hypothetical protein